MRDGGVYVSTLGSNACCFSCAGVLANPCSHATVTPLAPVSPFVLSRHANSNTTLCSVFYFRVFFKEFWSPFICYRLKSVFTKCCKTQVINADEKSCTNFVRIYIFKVKGILHIMYTPSCCFKPVWHSFFILTSIKMFWEFWFVYQHSSNHTGLE